MSDSEMQARITLAEKNVCVQEAQVCVQQAQVYLQQAEVMQLKIEYRNAVAKINPLGPEPDKKVAQKKSPKKSEATGKKAAKKPNTVCEISGAVINNISSFKFTLKDTEKSKYIISFNSKDGLTTTEYCPAHIVETNDDTADFLAENNTYQNTGTYSNSTKRIPGSFKFKKSDFVEYPVGTRAQFWADNLHTLETWVGKK